MKKRFVFLSFIFLLVLFGCEDAEESETSGSTVFAISTSPTIEYVLIGEEGKVGFVVGSGRKGEAAAETILLSSPISTCGTCGDEMMKSVEISKS